MKDSETRRYGWSTQCKLFLFVWFGLFIVLLSSPIHAEEDHWKALGILRLLPGLQPDFTLRSLDGESITLSGLVGKVILINFWATWCPPCREEMPSMERLYKKLKDKGFTILAVDIMEKPKTVREFVRKNKLSFPILLDTKGEVSRKYMVNALPSSFIVDKDGQPVGLVLGPRQWDSEHAEALINELLEQ